MEILGFCGIAFLIVMTFVATSNLIFEMNIFLDPKKNSKVKVGQGKKLKMLKSFLIFKTKKDKYSEALVFKKTFILSIITHIIYLLFIISFILLCVFYNATGCIRKVIAVFFLGCFFLALIFCCVLAVIYEIEKKKFKKRKKSKEMNFR